MTRNCILPGIAAAAAAVFMCLSLPGASVHAQQPVSAAQAEPELAIAMSQLQYFSHKLALSVEARNAELAGFYLHEVEEVAESIRDEIPDYEGYPIGPLVDSMLMPQIEALEDNLDTPAWDAAAEGLGAVVEGCNACHAATDHGFIVIELAAGSNPYMQSFQPGN